LDVGQVPINEMSSQGYPPKLLEFPFYECDYEILKDQRLGSGRFSDVFGAQPCEACPQSPSSLNISIPTPPTTPLRESFDAPRTQQPHLYAVKIPADRSSIPVLRREATIFSYLNTLSNSSFHIIPFHGLDTRTNSLVLTALPASLDSLITSLYTLPETTRTSTIARLFPPLARSLTVGLSWLHAQGIIHADIKPANILLHPHPLPLSPGHKIIETSFTPLFSDFTSAFHVSAPPSSSPALGGGTYDFLAPELLCRPYPDPSFASDVYALGMTLLFIMLGRSPFESAGNKWMVMEWAKSGRVMECVGMDGKSLGRLEDVAGLVKERERWDVKRFVMGGLRKEVEKRALEI
jgi:serine/threonine protein kinase